MPPFPKPRTRFSYDVSTERRRLRAHRGQRGVPHRGGDRLLIGSWNIANLGAQERRESDLELMATMLKWFDVVAVRECRENIADPSTRCARSGQVCMRCNTLWARGGGC